MENIKDLESLPDLLDRPHVHTKVLLLTSGMAHHHAPDNQSAIQVTRGPLTGDVRAMIEQEKPDAVLVEFDNGIAAKGQVRQLKHQVDQSELPLILYSRSFHAPAQKFASRCGFDDYYSGDLLSIPKKIAFISRIKRCDPSALDQDAHVRQARQHSKIDPLIRAIDIMTSLALLLVLLPLMLIISLAIVLESRGPILYVSRRAGRNYQIFDFYKFRTMYAGADRKLNDLSGKNQYGGHVFFKIKNDPRVTRLGAFLRRTSLDELPQLINVLKGDMSLVGNRPLPLYEAQQLTVDGNATRFLAPAGITGLWQITKRGKENMSDQERISLDVEYAEKRSFFLDMKILFNTIPAAVQKECV